MQAVAQVVSGQASLAWCARRYPVSDKTIRKGVRNYINGEVVQLERRGPKPAVDDKKMAAGLEAQRNASLSPYKYVDVIRLVVKRYPGPMAHGPEACEPSHPCGSR